MIMIVVMCVDGSTVVAETEVVCDCFHAQLPKDVKTNELSDRFRYLGVLSWVTGEGHPHSHNWSPTRSNILPLKIDDQAYKY